MKKKNAAELDVELDRFQSELEAKMKADPDSGDLEADLDLMIRAMLAVAGEHKGHVQERISGILGSLGLISADSQGDHCA